MAFTFKDFKAALKKHHSLTIHKTGKNFVWVEYDGVIPTDKCHYEINADEQSEANHDGSHLFVEIHFEGSNWERFVKCIENIDGLRIFPWLKDYKAFRLLTDNGFDMDGSDSIALLQSRPKRRRRGRRRTCQCTAGRYRLLLRPRSPLHRQWPDRTRKYIQDRHHHFQCKLQGCPGCQTYLLKQHSISRAAVHHRGSFFEIRQSK